MKPNFKFTQLVLAVAFSAPLPLYADDLFILVDKSEKLPIDELRDSKDTLDVELADIDADGDLDLFVIEGSATLAGFQNLLWINDGNGKFVDETAARLPAIQNNSTEIDLADIDGDGDLDALVANLGANQLLVNDGTGIFTERSLPQAAPPGPPGFFISFAPGAPEVFVEVSAEALFIDIDEDGDQDIVIANENPFPTGGPDGDQNRVLINDGEGHFTEATERLPSMLDNSAGIAAGDINADGHIDLVIGNIGQNSVLLNDGSGFFIDNTAAALPAVEDSTRKVVLSDTDGDGDLDLVVGNSRSEQNRLYLNDGTGVFTDATKSTLPFDDSTTTDIDLIDLNADGSPDLFVTNVGDFVFGHGFLGEPNRLLLNDGQGRFVDASSTRLPVRDGRSVNAEFGDINGDGIIDIVIGNSGGIDQSDLPPPDGAERLLIRKDCSADITACHMAMLDGLKTSIEGLNTEPFPVGDMGSADTSKNKRNQRKLVNRTLVAQQALDNRRIWLYWNMLRQISLRADGRERPADWVLGGAATRINDFILFSLQVLYRYGL